MKKTNLLFAICNMLFLLGLTSCNDDNLSVPISNEQSLCYKGYEIQFECDDLDADQAILFYDLESNKGWFGWIPSNGDYQTYILREIEGPNFTEIFPDFWGVDHKGEYENVNISFNLIFNNLTDEVTGSGVFINESGDEESCTLRSRENPKLNITDQFYTAIKYSFSCEKIRAHNAVIIFSPDYNSTFFGWQGTKSGTDNYAIKEIKDYIKINQFGFDFEEQFNSFYGIDIDIISENVSVAFQVEVDESKVSLYGQLTREDGTIEICQSNN